jgi:hypothetical protein
MTSPVSACLIVNDDPHLIKTIKCLAPHVAEICIAFTGISRDALVASERLVRKEILGKTQLVYFGGADPKTGQLNDFSAARQFSFSVATQPWILWADSDDLISGLEHLPEVISNLELAREMKADGRLPRLSCPYEYAYDKDGNCTELVVRERIVPNFRDFWQWKRPVHERLEAKDIEKQFDLYEPRLVWKHQSPPGRSTSERNVRILERYANECIDNGINDNLVYFDLGREYQMLGRKSPEQFDEATNCFLEYLQNCPNPLERATVYRHLSEIAWASTESKLFASNSPLDPALSKVWALAAAAEGGRFEDYFAVAKLMWIMAAARNEPAYFHQALEWAQKALGAPTKGMYDSNPSDRATIQELIDDCYYPTKRASVFIEYGGLMTKIERRREETPRAGAAGPAGRPNGPSGQEESSLDLAAQASS